MFWENSQWYCNILYNVLADDDSDYVPHSSDSEYDDDSDDECNASEANKNAKMELPARYKSMFFKMFCIIIFLLFYCHFVHSQHFKDLHRWLCLSVFVGRTGIIAHSKG